MYVDERGKKQGMAVRFVSIGREAWPERSLKKMAWDHVWHPLAVPNLTSPSILPSQSNSKPQSKDNV